MLSDEVIQTVFEKVGALLLEKFPDFRVPRISWSTFSKGMVAGRAYLRHNHIEINNQIPEEILETAIKHEIAHLVSFQQDRNESGHGSLWKKNMRALGGDPKATLQAVVPKARNERTWVYRCGCNTAEIYTRTHKRAQRGALSVKCCKCQEVMVWVGNRKGEQR